MWLTRHLFLSFSRPALKKYIQANYKGVATDRFDQLFNQALKKGAENNEFAFPKGMYLVFQSFLWDFGWHEALGPSGTVKLVKKEPAPKAKPVAKDTTKVDSYALLIFIMANVI